MKTTLSPEKLAGYVARQADHFFPDEATGVEREIATRLPTALERMSVIVHAVKPPLFQRAGVPTFDHLYSDQYAIFLYLLANELGSRGGSLEVAAKIYLLNKALHGLDVFYEVRLPRLFLLFHPVGTVLGRAEYSDGFIAMQNCTVGNVRREYPRFGRGVVLCAGASVLGAAHMGDGVCVGAGSMLIGGAVPENSTVTGRAGEVRIRPSRQPMWQDYFKSLE